MSETGSFICLTRYDYKLTSCCICVFYICVGGLCGVQMVYKSTQNENFFTLWWNFSCTFINGGICLSFGLMLSSILALLGMFINQPFFIIPLMITQMFLFVVMKINFANFLLFLLHEDTAPFVREFFIALGFTIIAAIITLILWILYCEFIQLSFASNALKTPSPGISVGLKTPRKSEPATNLKPSRSPFAEGSGTTASSKTSRSVVNVV